MNPVFMWMIAVIFVLFQFFLQLSSGVLLTHLMADFHLSAFYAGLLASSFYFVYVILQTPAGIVMDKFGPRRLLSGGGLVCAAGCFIFATSQIFAMAMLGRTMMGLGASFAFVGSIYLVGEWFPKRRFALMVGLAETFGMVGTILGNVYLSKLVETVDWRYLMQCSGYVAIVIALLCWILIRDRRNERRYRKRAFPWSEFFSGLRYILQHKGLWWNGMFSGLMFSVVTVFATLWGIPFLTHQLHTSQTMVAFLCSMVFVGSAMGAPVMGILYPILKKKSLFMSSTATFTGFLLIGLIYFTPASKEAVGLYFMIIGLGISTYVFNFTLADHLAPKHVRSTSIGFTNTLCMLPAPVLQPLIGWMIHARMTYDMPIAQLTTQDYRATLWIIPAVVFLAALIAQKIPEES